MPWKNGGGETTEIIVSPPAAGMDDFEWRVSMARVAADGPFSVFPGIDRSLTLLEGEGLVLEIDGQAPVHLTPASSPFAFRGDAATFGRLTRGAILDLNVMTRRGICSAFVTPVFGGPIRLSARGLAQVLILHHGRAESDDVILGAGDALLLGPEDPSLTATLAPGSRGYLVAVQPSG